MRSLVVAENGCYILNLDEKKPFGFSDGCRALKKGAKLALNFEKVAQMSGELEEFLKNLSKQFRVSVFGANTQVLGHMSLLNLCDVVSIYQNKNDFHEGKRKFVKRAFTVIK